MWSVDLSSRTTMLLSKDLHCDELPFLCANHQVCSQCACLLALLKFCQAQCQAANWVFVCIQKVDDKHEQTHQGLWSCHCTCDQTPLQKVLFCLSVRWNKRYTCFCLFTFFESPASLHEPSKTHQRRLHRCHHEIILHNLHQLLSVEELNLGCSTSIGGQPSPCASSNIARFLLLGLPKCFIFLATNSHLHHCLRRST